MDKKKLVKRGRDKQGEIRDEFEENSRVDGEFICLGFSVFYQTSFLRCNCCVRWDFITGYRNACTVVATLCCRSKFTNKRIAKYSLF